MSSIAPTAHSAGVETLQIQHFKPGENPQLLQTVNTTVKIWEEIESEYKKIVELHCSSGQFPGIDLESLSNNFSVASDMAANILDYDDSEGVYHVAKISTNVVGVAIIKDGLIDYILTAPQHRRDIGLIGSRHQSSIHGIGARLVKSMAFSRLSGNQETLLTVQSTDNSVGFFEKQGFRVSHTGDLVDMELSHRDGVELLSS